jgi:2,4-dienoyl-CoA reductase (NADPH2)
VNTVDQLISSNGLTWMKTQCDTIVVCAGQEPFRALHSKLTELKNRPSLFMIGGAFEAGELDAKRAIDQGIR